METNSSKNQFWFHMIHAAGRLPMDKAVEFIAFSATLIGEPVTTDEARVYADEAIKLAQRAEAT
jgi:hypothetical protein